MFLDAHDCTRDMWVTAKCADRNAVQALALSRTPPQFCPSVNNRSGAEKSERNGVQRRGWETVTAGINVVNLVVRCGKS